MFGEKQENKARDAQKEATDSEMNQAHTPYEHNKEGNSQDQASRSSGESVLRSHEKAKKNQEEQAEKEAQRLDEEVKKRAEKEQEGSETPVPIPHVVAKDGLIHHYSGQEDHTRLDFNKKKMGQGSPENK